MIATLVVESLAVFQGITESEAVVLLKALGSALIAGALVLLTHSCDVVQFGGS